MRGTQQKKGRDFWGPAEWRSLHVMGATFRPENSDAFVQRLWNLTKTLPCEKCRENLKAKLIKYPPEPYLTNNHNAFFYTYFIHDLVNQHLTELYPDKPKISPPYDEVKAYYFRALGEECRECRV